LRAGDDNAPHDEQQRFAQLLTPAPLPSDMQLCRFSHLFAGGYAAGYGVFIVR
jgi:Zn-dependent oligopeptidase